MIVPRRAAALIVTIQVLLSAAPALAAGAPPARLSPTAPSWLQPASTAPGSATGAGSSTTASTAPETATTAQLPRTGIDLMPEVVAGVALFGAGLGLRLVLRVRRA
jgi:hypothetical protein